MELEYTTERGTGTPVVYIHGWLGDRDSWKPVDRQTSFPNTRVRPDQRCHGRSRCEPFGLDDLRTDLDELLERLGHEEPVLAGHSLGGMVALTYALEKPVSGLFLAGTPAATPDPEGHGPQYFLEQLGTMDREEWSEGIVANYAPQDDGDRRTVKRELVEANETVLRCGLEAMIAYDVRDRLDEIDAPAFVVSGKDDGAIRPEQGQELADGLGCEHETIEASHLMHRERPRRLAGLFDTFMDGI
jgi:pimeloyl-ACP methyl ester carboxylesterase